MTPRQPARPVATAGALLHRGGDPVLTCPGRPPVAVNETAAALWELCDGETTVSEMVTAMDRFFDAGESEIRPAVESTLDELTRLGCIEWTEEGGD